MCLLKLLEGLYDGGEIFGQEGLIDVAVDVDVEGVVDDYLP